MNNSEVHVAVTAPINRHTYARPPLLHAHTHTYTHTCTSSPSHKNMHIHKSKVTHVLTRNTKYALNAAY